MRVKFKTVVMFDFTNFKTKYFLKVFDDARRCILLRISIFNRIQKQRERCKRNVCASIWSERSAERKTSFKTYKKKSSIQQAKKEHRSISHFSCYCYSHVNISDFLTTAIYLLLLTLVISCQVVLILLLDLIFIVLLFLNRSFILKKISATNSSNQRFISSVSISMIFSSST